MLRDLVLYLVPMILSLTVHEFAHALAATKLGDDTPEQDGRVTLSPLVHVDVLGTLIIPTLMIVTSGGAMFGWARPVRFNPARFRRGVDMRRGAAMVAFAGPASNLLLAILSIGLIAGLKAAGVFEHPSPTIEAFYALLKTLFSVNVGLFVFNLLPIPPFDGSRLLPRSMDDLLEKIAPYSFMLVMLVLMIPAVRSVLIDWPITVIRGLLLSLFGLR